MYHSDMLDEYYPVEYTAYAELEAEVVLFNMLFAGGGVRTSVWQLEDTGYALWPHKAVYQFNAGLRIGVVEMGWRHYCMHPVIPYFKLAKPLPIWEGAYDEVYLRISNKE